MKPERVIWRAFARAFIILAVIALPSGRCGAQGFKAEGSISYKVFYDQKLRFGSTNAFKVCVTGCDWLIRTVPLTKEPNDTLNYTEMSYHSGEIKMVYSFTKLTNGLETNTFIAKIEQNDVPLDDGSLINHLWLAFASSCSFAAVTNTQLKPIWLLDDDELRFENFQMEAIWSLDDQPPHLPRSVAYFNDGKFRTKNHNHRSTSIAPAPYARGYTNAIFSTLEWTNIGDLRLPKQFAFERFGINRKGGTTNTDLLRISHVEGVTEQLQVIPTNGPLEAHFSGKAWVSDKRFHPPIPYIEYQIKDAKWPDKTQVIRSPEYERKSRLYFPALRETPGYGKRRALFITLAVFIFGMPIMLMFRRTQKDHKLNQ